MKICKRVPMRLHVAWLHLLQNNIRRRSIQADSEMTSTRVQSTHLRSPRTKACTPKKKSPSSLGKNLIWLLPDRWWVVYKNKIVKLHLREVLWSKKKKRRSPNEALFSLYSNLKIKKCPRKRKVLQSQHYQLLVIAARTRSDRLGLKIKNSSLNRVLIRPPTRSSRSSLNSCRKPLRNQDKYSQLSRQQRSSTT